MSPPLRLAVFAPLAGLLALTASAPRGPAPSDPLPPATAHLAPSPPPLPPGPEAPRAFRSDSTHPSPAARTDSDLPAGLHALLVRDAPNQQIESDFAAWAEDHPEAALLATLSPEADPFLSSLQPLAATAAARRDLGAFLLWIADDPEARATPSILGTAACFATRDESDPRPVGGLALLTELFAGLPPSPERDRLWEGWLARHLEAHPEVADDWLPPSPPSSPEAF